MNKPNVVVMGSGYVGTVTAVELARYGDCGSVVGFDIDRGKVEKLLKGNPCINEPCLEQDLQAAIKNLEIGFTSDPECIREADVVITCVGTPTNDNEVNLGYIMDTASLFGQYHKPGAIFMIKSTVPPRTIKMVENAIISLNTASVFTVVTNPEFLREGSAVHDFLWPERIIFGIPKNCSEEIKDTIFGMYGTITEKTNVLFVSRESACLGKYASNAFLATKISFINTIAEICEEHGGDIEEVADIMGLDSRIGASFLNAGLGFGGSCFPKDTRGIIGLAGARIHNIFKSTLGQNNRQAVWPINALNKIKPDWTKDPITILGLSFKPNTDDIRESQSIKLITHIYTQINPNQKILAWDHIETWENNPSLERMPQTFMFNPDIDDVIDKSNVIIIATEWDDISAKEERLKKFLDDGGIIIDARNMFIPEFDEHPNYRRVGKKY